MQTEHRIPRYPSAPPLPPVAQPPSDLPPPDLALRAEPPKRRSPWLAIAVILGLAIGAGGKLAYDATRSGSTQGKAPIATLAPSTTAPPRSAPPSTAPASTATPATRSPSSSAPSTPARDLTIGLVNIDTELGFDDGRAAGTGIVLSASGDILTNNHVIEGSTRIRVTVVATGASYSATVVGTDPSDDVAVIHAEGANGLAVAPLGDSGAVRVGDAVVGIGNAGGTGKPTTSAGTVTALGQTITASDGTGADAETLHNLIAISARLIAGQSGGPLYNSAGKVVGIDTAGSSNGRFRFPNGGASDGYAIPINDALSIAKKIQTHDTSDPAITLGTPAFLGVSTSSRTGVLIVASVEPGTPAATIGLQAGDVITAVEGRSVSTPNELGTQLQSHAPGDIVTITWTRQGTAHSAKATLIAGPAN